MRSLLTCILLLGLFMQAPAQPSKPIAIKQIGILLQKAADKKGAKPLTGIRSVRFTGDTLLVETMVFMLLYPDLDFSQLTEVKEQPEGSPTGFTTLWLHFSADQVRYTDGKDPQQVKQFSVYVRPKDVEALKNLFSLLTR